MDETTNETTNKPDPIAELHKRLDAQDRTNESIMKALQIMSAATAASAPAADAPAAGRFRAPVEPPVERTDEDKMIDKVADRILQRLGHVIPGGAPVPAPAGGPCNLCNGEGQNAAGIGCNRCQGTGVMPGKRLS